MGQWISPTSHNDPDSKWTQETFAYDDNQTTQAQDTQTGGSWGPWLELSFATEKACSGCRFDATFDGATVDSITIQVNDSVLGWTTVYIGSYPDHVWVPFSFGTVYNFTTARVRFFSITTQNANFYEIDFWEYEAPPVVTTPGIYIGMGISGKMYRWTGSTIDQIASALNSQTIISAVRVKDGIVYGGTDPNGKLFAWDGGTGFIEMADQFAAADTRIWDLEIFGTDLYGCTNAGKLLKWDGYAVWQEKAPQFGSEGIHCMAVFNGKIYGGTTGLGKLLEWNGTNAWVEVAGQLNSQTTIFDLKEYNGKLYGCTSPGGRLFEWNGTNAWVEKAGFLDQAHLYSMRVFNSKLYGSGNLGKLYEWNDVSAWVLKSTQPTEDTTFYDMEEYDGGLYAGLYNLLKWNEVDDWVIEATKPDGFNNYFFGVDVIQPTGASGPGIALGHDF